MDAIFVVTFGDPDLGVVVVDAGVVPVEALAEVRDAHLVGIAAGRLTMAVLVGDEVA